MVPNPGDDGAGSAAGHVGKPRGAKFSDRYPLHGSEEKPMKKATARKSGPAPVTSSANSYSYPGML